MSYRRKRVGDELLKIISERLVKGLRDPLPGFVTVKSVEVNADFSRAQVYVAVFGSDEQKVQALEILKENKGYLRKEIGRNMSTRNTPELFFKIDETGAHAARIQSLLQDVKPIDEEKIEEDS